MAFPLVFEWNDKETDAVGWVVFDNVINGVSGGGIFMHPGATMEEVAAIAKNMSRKFTVTDPQIGGAKAGIKFDHRDPRAKEVLRRFILANEGLLRNYWVTAGDLNTDDSFIEKVIVEELKLSCCQAQLGKVVSQKTGLPDLSKQLAQIIPMPASPYFPMIEAAVGYGMAISVEEGLKLIGKTDGSAKVAIQGFGAVGSSLAYYLYTKKIAKVVAIADIDGIIFDDKGLPITKILEWRKENVANLRKNDADAQKIGYYSKNCLVNIDPVDCMNEEWGQKLNGRIETLVSIDADVFCPCATRYILTPKVVEAMKAKLLISGANNPYGQFKDGKLVEDIEGQVVQILEEKKVIIIPDWVSNSGTAQLFHRSLSVNFNLDSHVDPHTQRIGEQRDVAKEILEACALPIRVYIAASLSMVKGNILRLHRGAEQLAAQRLKFPLMMGAKQTTENKHRSRYALPPIPISYTPEKRAELCLSLAAECIEPKELVELFRTCQNPVAYDGFEPSGRMHIAQGLFKARLVNNLTKSGFTYIFWVADWFALLNHKMGGNLEAIQTLGKYFIEIWKASGMDMSRVKFLWASEEFSKHGDEYWAKVLHISTQNSLNRIKRCCTIMGRKEGDDLSASQVLYPCMQAADVFFLGVDVCQLGMDQRKVNMLAREYASETKQTPPIILSHPMLPGLKKNQEKMSKSDPASAIFMEDSTEEVEKKIKGAYCPTPGEMEKIKDDKGQEIIRPASNPCLQYAKYLVFSQNQINIALNGICYASYGKLEEVYNQGIITPQDLKSWLASNINQMLEPVRNHFKTPYASKLLQEVKDLQIRYAK